METQKLSWHCAHMVFQKNASLLVCKWVNNSWPHWPLREGPASGTLPVSKELGKPTGLLAQGCWQDRWEARNKSKGSMKTGEYRYVSLSLSLSLSYDSGVTPWEWGNIIFSKYPTLNAHLFLDITLFSFEWWMVRISWMCQTWRKE
jgi:hypothetical protein